jgi:hypothetical protein
MWRLKGDDSGRPARRLSLFVCRTWVGQMRVGAEGLQPARGACGRKLVQINRRNNFERTSKGRRRPTDAPSGRTGVNLGSKRVQVPGKCHLHLILHGLLIAFHNSTGGRLGTESQGEFFSNDWAYNRK